MKENELSIIPLGGMGNVTQNMFLYVYGKEILVVDCGIGFPDHHMPGVDILIPDTTFLHTLLDQGKEIVGMVLTHGHDDHIAATPYILPELEEFPVYALGLTAGFARNRMKDGNVDPNFVEPKDGEWLEVSEHFQIMPVPMTHSVPDTRHYAIKTPEGIIYHGSDYKLDQDPVDGIKSDEALVRSLGEEGILCMMVDCLRVEKDEHVPSESTVGPVLEETFGNIAGKVVVTLMSSHLHRIQQTIDAAVKFDRKVVFVGRSVEQNVDVALDLGKLTIPDGVKIDKRDIKNYSDDKLCVIIAGSQGQEGSSLVRAVYGEHRDIRFTDQDIVVFSADAIPGNYLPYYQSIDELMRNGIKVLYPTILPGIHQSGHASAPEQRELVSWGKAKYVFPIGGDDRHRFLFKDFVAEPEGYKASQVLLPDNAHVLTFKNGSYSQGEEFPLRPRTVDGLGIGDVGPRVLSDRVALSDSGILVVVIPKEGKNNYNVKQAKIISKGFVFMEQADEVIEYIKQLVGSTIDQHNKAKDHDLKNKIERKLSKKLYKTIRRNPLVVVEFI